uniref:Uncharacterized protein n=3 Tax=Candidatus Kentrum sp. FM TaxID=2126340 RepID=A0A450TFA5_9GAMM|nr:MAG: hypothetical protein BECKFM1743C_GA0114222_104056 [Candidatus Kentron sp. FM]
MTLLLSGHFLFWLLLDFGSMADRCNYTSEIDMDARMSGANTGVRPYAPPNVRANLVFAHYARFALMPKSCGFTTLCYRHFADQPGIQQEPLFFMYAFHAAISITYWFAIAIAIRYRSHPAFSIASSDSDPERTTITGYGLAAL